MHFLPMGWLFALPSLGLVLYWMAVRRQWFQRGMLGLRGSRLLHGVKEIDPGTIFAEKYFKQLKKDIRRVYEKSEISWEYVKDQRLRWEHFLVIFRHERRIYSNLAAAILISMLRFIMATLCNDGNMDEFRLEKEGTLVAFSCNICMGRVLRIMWFYSANHKACIFHKVIDINVERVLKSNGKMSHIDVGPGRSTIKEKLGFLFTKDYAYLYKTS